MLVVACVSPDVVLYAHEQTDDTSATYLHICVAYLGISFVVVVSAVVNLEQNEAAADLTRSPLNAR